jgi:hypothetical protein
MSLFNQNNDQWLRTDAISTSFYYNHSSDHPPERISQQSKAKQQSHMN